MSQCNSKLRSEAGRLLELSLKLCVVKTKYSIARAIAEPGNRAADFEWVVRLKVAQGSRRRGWHFNLIAGLRPYQRTTRSYGDTHWRTSHSTLSKQTKSTPRNCLIRLSMKTTGRIKVFILVNRWQQSIVTVIYVYLNATIPI